MFLHLKKRLRFVIYTLMCVVELCVFCLVTPASFDVSSVSTLEKSGIFFQIFFGNLNASLFLISLGVIPLFLGVLFGSCFMARRLFWVGGLFVEKFGAWRVLLCVLPHALLEIPAMVFSVILGVLLSRALMCGVFTKAGRAELFSEVKQIAKDFLFLLLPLVLLGALLESAVSIRIVEAVAKSFV